MTIPKINIIIQAKHLSGKTQAQALDHFAQDGFDNPVVFDLNAMFILHEALMKQCIEKAMSEYVPPVKGFTLYEVYCLLQTAFHLDDGFALDLWEIYLYSDLDNMTLDDIINTITNKAEGYYQFVTEVFETAKEAIVAQTINCSINGDVNTLDLDSLFEYATNLNKTFTAKGLTFTYCESFAKWESPEGFELELGEGGKPFNEAPEKPFELDSGELVHITSLGEVA
jgi:hypothetical protein